MLDLVPLAGDEIPEDVVSSSSSEKIRVLRLRMVNNEDRPIRLAWGDFLSRDPESGRWVGGWWKSDMDTLRKMELVSGSAPSGQQSFIPPRSSIEYLLVDSWPSDEAGLDYKFACLASLPSGETTMFETLATKAQSLNLARSGVEMAAAGVTAAVEKLVTAPPSDSPAEPGSLVVSLVHTPAGPVEVGKNAQLKEEISTWLSVSGEDIKLFHVYRTEVINNTQAPLRLVMMEAATSSEEKWLTGHLRPPVMGLPEIVSSGYVERVGVDGTPAIEKMSDGWLAPGDRAIFPALWHATPSSAPPTAARWRALLVDREGVPRYVEGVTPPDIPLMPVPTRGESSPTPSPND